MEIQDRVGTGGGGDIGHGHRLVALKSGGVGGKFSFGVRGLAFNKNFDVQI